MKIQTKAFWTFQLAVAFVSAVIQIIFWYVTGFIISEPTDLFAGLLFSICSVIAFAITLFPAWKACIRQKRIGGSNPPHSARNTLKDNELKR